MWSPAPEPRPFKWGLVKASYPHAYRALFEVEGAKLSTALGEARPLWFGFSLSEQQLLDREYTVPSPSGRHFHLSDLFAFFAAYQYIISVRGLRVTDSDVFPAQWQHGYVLRTPTGLVGRNHPDGPYPFPSHDIALQAGFLMAFHHLDIQLRK